MMITNPNIKFASYFIEPTSSPHKQYLALRRFFADGYTAEQVASESGYSISSVYSMVRDFKEKLNSSDSEDPFFRENKTGRKPIVHKETEIAEQVDFFHLNRNSSGIVVKVDFDLTMTILAHNLYKLFCKDFCGYSHCGAQTIFDKFTSAPGQIHIDDDAVSVKLKRKRSLPILLEHMNAFKGMSYPWLDDRNINFYADSTT